MDTPKPGETVTPPSNEPANPVIPAPAAVAPVVEDNSQDEVVRLRKELEQKTMRENQLQNQLKAKEDAEAAAKAKEMEDQNQFKELFEQEKAKREALEAAQTESEKKTEIEKAKTDVLAEYSDEVKTLAEEVGVDLISSDESAVSAFREKLEKINNRVVTSGNVGPNNRNTDVKPTTLTGDALKEALQDPNQFHNIVVASHPGIAAMTAPKK